MTDRMRMETPDLTEKNIEKIAELFPNCITESKDEKGNLKKAINFDILKQMLSKEIVDGDEAYEFTWVGKKAAMLEANKPIRKTLRPCPEESLNWDTTQNLYIEGDNLDVLKLLQESYLGKVKMIYIDPPYNTGSDSFVYPDNYTIDKDDYELLSGQVDEEGNILFKENSGSNPRFHSDWCSMMYSRLSIVRSLLSEDGLIFISLDDNEIDNLKKICDEIFGSSNFMVLLTRRCMHTVRNSSKDFNKNTDYILVYAYNKERVTSDKNNRIREHVDKSENYKLNDNDGRGFYKLDPIYARNYAKPYTFTFKNGLVWSAPEGSFPRYSIETLTKMEENNQLNFDGKQPRAKRYLNEVQEGQPPDSLLKEEQVGFNSDGTKILANVLGNDKVFSQPKPIQLIKYLISIIPQNKDSIILDFFSGSATTAHAVMQLNAEDGGNRKFIMVQLQEPCDEKSEAYKAGFKNICEIGKERIRRAGKKILEDYSKSSKCEDALKPLLEEGNKRGGDRIRSLFSSLEQPSSQEDWIATQSATARNDGNSTGGSNTLSLNKVSSCSVTPQSAKADSSPQVEPLDIGFRVFKLADSNMKDVYYSADEYSQQSLQDFVSNIKEDRTDLDLLFGCLLEWGLPLSMPYSSEKINSFNVHTYNDGDLIACFDENVSEEVIKIIAKRKPLRAVFRDSSFANSPSKINVTEIFKLLSPNTRVKVI